MSSGAYALMDASVVRHHTHQVLRFKALYNARRLGHVSSMQGTSSWHLDQIPIQVVMSDNPGVCLGIGAKEESHAWRFSLLHEIKY